MPAGAVLMKRYLLDPGFLKQSGILHTEMDGKVLKKGQF